MKRRNFFALLFAAAGMPVLAKKITGVPVKTYTATLGTIEPELGPIGSLGPSGCPTGLPGPAGSTSVWPSSGGQIHLNGDGSGWKTLSQYQTSDVIYMDGREYRVLNS